ncbi:MAG: hypothetical protein HRU70_01320 [Phycisphaeraceae bacterium]|nr:MAG: hypothetical protein HRU70_01320 [Phycisphaeraceae bacterium]
MSDRRRRFAVIKEVLTRGTISSQDELQREMASRGVEATQATLSRDLRELGAIKTPAGYRLPTAGGGSDRGRPLDPAVELRITASTFVQHVQQAASLVVVKTGPGHASALASWLDRAPHPDMVGTLAGDDTILIATGGSDEAGRVTQWLRSLIS